jgi:hypothetical protein
MRKATGRVMQTTVPVDISSRVMPDAYERAAEEAGKREEGWVQ